MILSHRLLEQSVLAMQTIAPEEACGVVIEGKFHLIPNVSTSPKTSFVLSPKVLAKLIRSCGRPEVIIHSHTDGQDYPSVADMEAQMAGTVPWVTHVFNDGNYKCSFDFGDHLLDAPLVGRRWRPGVFDCMSLFRSYYWQKHRIRLPDFPRTDGWWDKIDTLKALRENLRNYPMFEEIPVSDAHKDCTLFMAIRSGPPNHLAVMDTDQTFVHHPSRGLSGSRPCATLQATIWKAYRLRKD